jgi:hypothetical protein
MIDNRSLGLPEHIFNSFQCHFNLIIFQKSIFWWLSFDSANDKRQPQIDLFHRCFTSTQDSLLDMYQLLPCYRHYFELSSIGTATSACLIYRQVSSDHQWSCGCHSSFADLLSNDKNRQKLLFWNLNVEKDIKIDLKMCLTVPASRDLQFVSIVPIFNIVTLSL